MAVPRSAVGVVIGKNGEMIKKIQNETGARVQFQQGRDDNPEERMCALTGTMNQIEDARQRIEELIESVLVVHLLMCFNLIRTFIKLLPTHVTLFFSGDLWQWRDVNFVFAFPCVGGVTGSR